MSDGSPNPPPPGWQPPPGSSQDGPQYRPPPGYPSAAPGAAPYAPPPPPPYAPPGHAPLHQARPVYKPGTIPLRPLGLSDMFGGAIETIRRNPKATVGIAALVLTCLLALPVLVTFVWGSLSNLGGDLATADEVGGTSAEDVGFAVSLYGSLLFGVIATIVLTGMIVHVVEHAARGQKLSAAEAWRLTRGRVWRLIGLALLPFVMLVVVVGALILLIVLADVTSGTTLAVVLGIVGGLAALVGTVFLYTRLFLLAAPALVLERRGVFSAMGRSWELSRGAFWRLFGILLLTQLCVGFASQIIGIPFGLLGVGALALVPDLFAGLMLMLIAQFLSQVISGALTTPFSASIAALQYLDQRIRKEGYDIALISQLPGMPAPGSMPGLGPVPPPPYGAPPPPYAPPPPPSPPPYGAPTG
ncbi:MAG: glycerophosphoryl diester phosphodiesterase membrane domain-containing protein [Nocardioidaceae bacterium]|nr:glycerophosphoryl diester phosphodiesterase membrane domain-containing protein [Nocardioidaceae bacterium]